MTAANARAETIARPVSAASAAPQISLEQYYSEAGPDYAAWSPEFNMHFGYYRAGANPLNREAMLEQMNAQVLVRMPLDGIAEPQLLDLGCGLGATLRSFARRLPSARLFGITRVPWQVEHARILNEAAGCGERVRVIEGDYQDTALPSSSYDGVYAVESSCHARGADKGVLLGETYRLLRPGGRLVVADGFLASGRFLTGLQERIYPDAMRVLGCRRVRAASPLHGAAGADWLRGYHGGAPADAGGGFGGSRPVGDIEIPGDGYPIRRSGDDPSAMEQHTGTGVIAAGQRTVGAHDLLHDHGEKAVGAPDRAESAMQHQASLDGAQSVWDATLRGKLNAVVFDYSGVMSITDGGLLSSYASAEKEPSSVMHTYPRRSFLRRPSPPARRSLLQRSFHALSPTHTISRAF